MAARSSLPLLSRSRQDVALDSRPKETLMDDRTKEARHHIAALGGLELASLDTGSSGTPAAALRSHLGAIPHLGAVPHLGAIPHLGALPHGASQVDPA